MVIADAGEGHPDELDTAELLAQDHQTDDHRPGAGLGHGDGGDRHGADADGRRERHEGGGVEDARERCAAPERPRQHQPPASSSAPGRARPSCPPGRSAASATGGSARRLDEEEQRAGEESRGEQRPAARRRHGGARAAPSQARAALSFGARSTEAIRPPATASGRPINASVGSVSPSAMALTAAKPPASDPSGVTTERLPVEAP